MARVLAIIDGEHYPPVVVDALARIEETHQVCVALLVGGTEKIESPKDDDYGVPLLVTGPDPAASLADAIEAHDVDLVIDLSDEPVVGYEERFRLASYALAAGVTYEGADFRFVPPRREKVAQRPSIAVLGTGKRIGKTAVSAYLARRLVADGHLPVVVAMGRGGPAEPELIRGDEVALTVDELVERSRAGAHAASDYFEDAVMSRVPTIGARRCGGGLAGETYVDTVIEAAHLANALDEADVQVYEGSGAAIPPVATDATAVVTSAAQPLDHITGLFGTYRLLRADVLIVTMCEPGVPPEFTADLVRQVRRERGELPIIYTVFRPKPLSSIDGHRVFLATTAQPEILATLSGHLEAHHGCEVVAASPNLSDRAALRRDIAKAGRFDTLATELKAAAVDVAAQEARRAGAEVVLLDNEPVDAGEPGALDEALVSLTRTALSRYAPPV